MTSSTLVLADSPIVEASSPSGYRLPPEPIPQIIDGPRPPGLSLSPNRKAVAWMEREGLLSIERLAEPELRLAGIRFNARTNGPSRERYYSSLQLGTLEGSEKRPVRLPTGAQLSNFGWSPDSSRLAFTNTVEKGIELWILEVATGKAQKAFNGFLNATLGSPFSWMPDSRTLIVKAVPAKRGLPPALPKAPAGPIIQENIGKAAPARTYQDLLSDAHDEDLFEYYATSQLVLVKGKAVSPLGESGIYADTNASPNGEYILTSRLKRPFSFIAPLSTFGLEIEIVDLKGKQVHLVQDRTQISLPPIGRDMVSTEPRGVQWRADAPATLVWVQAMDEGNAKAEAKVRDRIYFIDAPFDRPAQTLMDLDQRYAGIYWGKADLALVQSRWSTSERTKTYVLNPAQPEKARVLWDRPAQDRYGNPGTPVTEANATGNRVLRFAPGTNDIFLNGEGASPKGNYPFLDRLNVDDGKTTRIWQAADPYFETVSAILDDQGQFLLTRRESLVDAPNYFLRDIKANTTKSLTSYPDPAPQLAGIQREIITYKRADGVTLSATLYTPPGYDPKRDGRLPTLFWAYPREFRDADSAGQISDSPNRFSRPDGSSHLFLLTQGYAILDGPAMPIIGVGDVEPNDTYIEQLTSSAKAAVDKVVEMGVADRDRIAVGGHSYGAFMTANLLAHSDLFRAGIARSGAYNRTLTPFGFQSEPRTFWEAQNIYNQMSPFNFAQKINEPLLMIHGVADNNSGTFPVQSERMYQALQGQGATVKLVLLPHESHGYAARESILHVLAEMIEWMDKYVKNAPPRATESS